MVVPAEEEAWALAATGEVSLVLVTTGEAGGVAATDDTIVICNGRGNRILSAGGTSGLVLPFGDRTPAVLLRCQNRCIKNYEGKQEEDEVVLMKFSM